MSRFAPNRPAHSRRRTMATLAVAVGTALAGCTTTATGAGTTTASSGQSTTLTTPSQSATPAPSASSASSESTPSATGATSAAASPHPFCTGLQLRVASGPVGAGAGQRYLPLVFTNVGVVTCTLYGYPGVAGLNSAALQVVQARREPGWTTATITLGPGHSVSSLVHASVVPIGSISCPADYAALLVTPPNTTSSVRVPVSLPSCGGLTVRPVVTGTSGM